MFFYSVFISFSAILPSRRPAPTRRFAGKRSPRSCWPCRRYARAVSVYATLSYLVWMGRCVGSRSVDATLSFSPNSSSNSKKTVHLTRELAFGSSVPTIPPQGHFDVARTLLVQARPKPNVDYQNSNGGTALMMAAGAGKLECVRLLLAHGARHDLLTGMISSIRYLQIRHF
jgi:hypothetical protein